MQVANYDHFGGRHWDSANVTHLLAHAGVASPVDGKPLSEAMVFGIAGGIGAGYSFCPSVPGYGCGSGISIVGRCLGYSTDSTYPKTVFDRLGVTSDVRETSGVKGAHQNLLEALSKNKPAILWCSRFEMRYTHVPMRADCSMYAVVCHGIDEAKGEAYVADHSATSMTVSIEQLQKSRNRVCSFKNRSLTIEPPKSKLSATTLKDAVVAGLKQCAESLAKPKIKTFSFEGLDEWSKIINSSTNKKGWLKMFPGGKLYGALSDVFISIETIGNGGGLYRTIYADFLDEAAGATKNKKLAACAKTYRALGERWTNFAAAMLPDEHASFKKAKQLQRSWHDGLVKKGEKGLKEVAAAREAISAMDKSMQNGEFPLKPSEVPNFLAGLQKQLIDLIAAERVAAAQLASAT
jgi:hypothetical protein